MIPTVDYIFDKISYFGDQNNKVYEKYKKVFSCEKWLMSLYLYSDNRF
jgi:hypothetical protein